MVLLATRLIVELLGVAALGFWGAHASVDAPLRIALAIGSPVALVVLWAVVVAPKAHNPIPLRARGLIGTGLLVLVAVALASAGQPGWAVVFAGVVVADEALILALEPDTALEARRAGPRA
jgi:hypothetical protein